MSEAAETAATDDETAQDIAERSAKAMLSRDKTSQALGMTIERIAPGEADVSMTVREDMVNGHGTCHGGYIFTFADCAFAFACNSYNKVSVAASADISFLRAAMAGDRLTARAREIFREGRNGIYDVEVHNQNSEVIAQFRGKSRTLRGEVDS